MRELKLLAGSSLTVIWYVVSFRQNHTVRPFAEDYLFATKIMAGRQKDREDIKALAAKLKIVKRRDVLALVTEYVSNEDISTEVLDEVEYLFET